MAAHGIRGSFTTLYLEKISGYLIKKSFHCVKNKNTGGICMRIHAWIVFCLLSLCAVSACASKEARIIEGDAALQRMVGKTYYAATNVYFNVDMQPNNNGPAIVTNKISSLNFIGGDKFIPAGTQISISKISRLDVYLSTASHGAITYTYNDRTLQFTEPSANIQRMLSSDLSQVKAAYEALPQIDKDGVDSATVRKGMSKKGVLMAVGYPSEIAVRNPMKSDEWLYWKGRGDKLMILFDAEGLVERIVE